MADNRDDDIMISVGAYADEKSAKKAINDLTDSVLSSLKDGYIEVPAEIKASYARGSKELEKAQKDVIAQWEKMSKKGFSSSPEYLDELIAKYQKFKRLAGREGKGNSKQTRWLSKTIGDTLQPYLAQKRELDAIIKSFEKSADTIKKSTTKKTRKAKDLGSHSKEEIDANIKQEKDRKYKGVKSTGPKGLSGDSSFDRGVATSKTVMDSDRGGPYGSAFARQQRKSEKEARKENAKTLKVRVDKEEASKAFAEAMAKNKYHLTDTQKAAGLSDAAVAQLPKLLTKIEQGEGDTAQQEFLDTLTAIFKLDAEAGRKLWNTVKKEINITLGKYFSVKGRLGATDGEDKSAKSKNPEVEQALKNLLKQAEQVQDKVIQSFIDEETTLSKSKKKSGNNSTLDKVIQGITDANKGINANKAATEEQLGYDMVEHSAERVSDRKAGKADRTAIDKLETDMSTGFNTDANSSALIDITKQIKSILDSINEILAGLATNGMPTRPVETGKKKEVSGLLSPLVYNAETKKFEQTSVKNEPVDYTDPKNQGLKIAQAVEFSESEIKTYSKGLKGILEKAFEGLKFPSEADRIMSMNAKEQKRMYAQRLETYGLNRGRSMTDTGDIADVKRTKSLFGWIYKNDEKNKQLFQNIKLTPGFTGENAIDTTAILKSLNKVLSGPEMFKAQTGGTLRNIIGSMTGYIGMPSLEKSRAQAEGLNQVMANVRNEVLGLIQDIQRKESALAEMKELGTAKFTKDGQITEDSSLVAQNMFVKLEEQKGVLKAALAEVGAIDKVVDRCGGKVSKIIKQIGFVMPELLDQNTILQNINAGLDKNGKALKFQSRTAEMLSYAYQLMARHIGQMFKNWMVQLNPLTQIKKLFSDFSSYNTKWQRTMNVVKYNLRSIILPLMDKIAQLLVNMIGFADIILQKVQAAFGYTPISLFDQENAKKFKDEVEQISSISAGFDELHDIGTDEDKSADNLLGDIYKPQLSQEWIDLANEIGDLFAGLITGDLGFGEVMKRILSIVWEGLKIIGGYVWDFIKNTIWPLIKDNWVEILAWVLGAFLAWKGLKLLGNLLWNALFGNFTSGTIGGLFGKVSGWIIKALGATSVGRGILEGITSVFTGKGGLLATLKSVFVGHEAITAFGAWGETLGAIFIQALGVAIGGGMVIKGFDMVADDAAYNAGLMANGGNEEDQKSGLGGKVLGTLGGAIIGGFATGGPIGAAIGAIAGLLVVSLAPAFEQAEIAARNMNNEMQKIEYYEGAVAGAQTEVDEMTEMMDILNQTLEAQKEKVMRQGEQLGISTTRMNELTTAVTNGTFSTDMLTGKEVALTDSLLQLSAQQQKNEDATKKLTEAKRKLEKAEIDLAIAEDVAAGNFEMAAARIEYAMASEVYDTTEASQKMSQLLKETNDDMKANLLEDMTPDMEKNWISYVTTTEQGKRDLAKILMQMNEDQRAAFSKNFSSEGQAAMQQTMNSMQDVINDTSWDWSHPFKSLGSLFTGDWSWKAQYASFDVGTNYVPNDGFAYIHKGEAIIPADENVFARQGKAWQGQELTNARMLNAITNLENTIKQGIPVSGQFVQRGSDLVAVVNKTKAQTGADLLSNVSYAR